MRRVEELSSFLRLFLGKEVVVDVYGFSVRGRLVCFKPAYPSSHLPWVLVLENEDGRHLVRKWGVVKLEGREGFKG
ncbi:MAG: hypothetical protein ACKD6O_08265 [Candidatus Bathyarchaeota archaeon]